MHWKSQVHELVRSCIPLSLEELELCVGWVMEEDAASPHCPVLRLGVGAPCHITLGLLTVTVNLTISRLT